MRRWLPAPLVSASLLLMWLMLNQTVASGALAARAACSRIVAPLLARPLQPHGHARLRRPRALLRLLWFSAIEIVRSCFNVSSDHRAAPLGRRELAVHPRARSTCRSPHGLALLSCLINSTPGTVWVEILPDSHELLLHVFDLHDEAWWIDTIKTRYEQPIIEVFDPPQPHPKETRHDDRDAAVRSDPVRAGVRGARHDPVHLAPADRARARRTACWRSTRCGCAPCC